MEPAVDWKKLIKLPMHKRNQIWLKFKNQKLLNQNRLKRDTELDGCTFRPRFSTHSNRPSVTRKSGSLILQSASRKTTPKISSDRNVSQNRGFFSTVRKP